MPRLVGSQRSGEVAIVEDRVSASFVRKARITLLALTPALACAVAGVLATMMHPARAAVFGVVAGAACGLVAAAIVTVWPVLRVIWHWGPEIAVFVGVVAAWAFAASALHPLAAVGLVIVLGCIVGLVRPVRRRLVAWTWCAVVRHRLRLCFAEFIRSAARAPGCLPLILVARPTPAGERVWVWLRPGLDLSDLDGRTGKLAVACWAGEVRVVRASARHAALIRVDITRRDPLTGMVRSPLARSVPTFTDPAPVSPAGAPLALDLCDVPEEEVPVTRGARR